MKDDYAHLSFFDVVLNKPKEPHKNEFLLDLQQRNGIRIIFVRMP